MPDIIEGISPTRMELLKLSRRVKLAEKGHKLLKEKRDALISEFLDIVEEVRGVRNDVEGRLEEAYRNLLMAQATLGVESVKEISYVTAQEMSMDFDTRNIMGVKVPLIEAGKITRNVTQRGYGFVDTSATIDECAKSFEESIEMIIKLAEIEETVKKLAIEVEKTKRRVNALEYIIVPRLSATAKYIRMRLEEMERENFSRLKKIKASLERKAEA
ncbi:MAG: V-type ATP synthase subunit D [Halobacteriota archaeon]|nr:V-type ATP synthase subunit D [Halobacteriota archaeon]